MPTYDYRCKDCSFEFELFRKMVERNDLEGLVCDNCSSYNIEKIYKKGQGGLVDPGILAADKNIEKSGVLKRLNEMKAAHPYMQWKG